MVDTLGDFVAALNLMLGDLKLPDQPKLDRSTVEPMVGKGSENLIKSVLNQLETQCLRARTATELIAIDGLRAFDAAYHSSPPPHRGRPASAGH